jgi:hypothetical protein
MHLQMVGDITAAAANVLVGDATSHAEPLADVADALAVAVILVVHTRIAGIMAGEAPLVRVRLAHTHRGS